MANNLDSFTFNPAGLDPNYVPQAPQYYAPGTQWPIATDYVPGTPVNTTNPQPGVPTLTTEGPNWGYKPSGGRKRKRSTHRRSIRKRSTRRRRNKRSAKRRY